MTRTISSSDSVIDSRDVTERLRELEDKRNDLVEAQSEATTREDITAARENLEEWDAEYGDELASLRKLNDDGEDASSEWSHGVALIRESYWVDYVQELLEDLGELPKHIPHYIVIDWDKTADNIRVDYSELEFDGVTFYYRD